VAAIVAFVYALGKNPHRRRLWLATGLFIGGALGNLADRALTGAVTDFIAVGHLVFNLADLAVAAGLITVVCLV
jgi:signal peptidase II